LQKRRASSLAPYLYGVLKEIWELLSWEESQNASKNIENWRANLNTSDWFLF